MWSEVYASVSAKISISWDYAVHTFVLNMHEYFTFNLYFATLFTGSAFTTILLLIMTQNPSTCSRNAPRGLLQTSTGYPVILSILTYFLDCYNYWPPDSPAFWGSEFFMELALILFVLASMRQSIGFASGIDLIPYFKKTSRVIFSTTFNNLPFELKSLAFFTASKSSL